MIVDGGVRTGRDVWLGVTLLQGQFYAEGLYDSDKERGGRGRYQRVQITSGIDICMFKGRVGYIVRVRRETWR